MYYNLALRNLERSHTSRLAGNDTEQQTSVVLFSNRKVGSIVSPLATERLNQVLGTSSTTCVSTAALETNVQMQTISNCPAFQQMIHLFPGTPRL
jgi:hypothetical protein